MNMGFLSGSYMHFYTGDHSNKYGLDGEDINITVLFIEAESPDDLDEWVRAEEECEAILIEVISSFTSTGWYKPFNGNSHKKLTGLIKKAIEEHFSWETMETFVEFDVCRDNLRRKANG